MKRLRSLLVILVMGLAVPAVGRADELVTYDLTPTLRGADRKRAWDEQHLVAALQGLANRERERLYVFFVGEKGATDRFWWDYLRSPGAWLEKREVEEVADLPALLARFAGVHRGLVVYDEKDVAASLVASTVAGAEGLLPVRVDEGEGSLYRWLTEDPAGPRLGVRVDLREIPVGKSGSRKADVTLWAVERYLKSGTCDARVLAYYPNVFGLSSGRAPLDRTLLCNHDYFISRKAFFFDLNVWEDDAPDDEPQQPLGEDLRTLRKVLHAAYEKAGGMIHVGGFTPWDQKYTRHTGRKHGEVATEWRLVEILSCFDAYVDADAAGLHAMANASFFQHFPLKERYPQGNRPTEDSLREKGYLTADGKVVAKNYATIYVGDYDSAAWLYQQLPGKWRDGNRGKVPLGWAFNPALERRFPVGLHYAREKASAMDTFVAGDSGYGYLNPGYLVGERTWSGLPSGLERWERLCEDGYRRWDLSVTGFVIDGNAPAMSEAVKQAYARFSSGGVVAQKVAAREAHGGTPFLRMGADLADPAKGARQVAGAFPEASPKGARFAIFRTILWSPTQHKELFEAVRRERPDVEFVGPEELFRLMALDAVR